MKIAIVGGGFYGCFIAYKILKKFPKLKISVFEKNSDLLLEAAINNQYRLHQGFHYPRSNKTILQTIYGFKKFTNEFKRFIYIPKENYYLIHKKSKISFSKYVSIFKKLNLKFNILKVKKIPFLKKIQDYTGAIKVFEGTINFRGLYKFLKKKLYFISKIDFFFNNQVIKIDKKKGLVFTKDKFYKFNLIINTSYTDLNIGLSNKFKVKYEIASIIQIQNFLGRDFAITIMDGNFTSIYPVNKEITTLSSVKYTPIKRFRNIFFLKKFLKKNNIKDLLKKNSKKIIKDIKIYFNIKNILIKKISFAPKVKLINDNNARRDVIVKKEEKIISILCGKIDAVYLAWNKIDDILKKSLKIQ